MAILRMYVSAWPAQWKQSVVNVIPVQKDKHIALFFNTKRSN